MSGLANVRGKLNGALAFFHHEAAGGLVLVVWISDGKPALPGRE